MAVGPYISACERLWMRQVRVEGQEQCGAFLNDADPGVPAAVDTALVPFGRFKPALQIEVVLRYGRLFPANKQPRSKAAHDMPPMVLDGIVALLELLLQDLKPRLTLGTRATLRFERRLDRPDLLHVGPHGLLGVMDCPQTPVNRAR